MLAKKYYAQRNTSKGSMNTHAVTQSSSSRGSRLIRNATPIVKQMPQRNASTKIEVVKREAQQCIISTPSTKTTTECNLSNSCFVVKEPIGKKTSSEYTTDKTSKALCSKENFWGTIPPMNNCGHP